MENTPQKEPVTLFDGPNKNKKRWAIGIMAILGLAGTMSGVPDWLQFIAQAIVASQTGGSY